MAYTYIDYLERIDPNKVAEGIKARAGAAQAQQRVPAAAEGTGGALDTLRRLAASVAQGIGDIVLPIAELPVLISHGLEELTGGRVYLPGLRGAQPGEVLYKPVEEAISEWGGLKGTTGEAVARFAGGAAGWLVPELAGQKLLSSLAQAGISAARATGQLEKAKALEEAAKAITRPMTLGQRVARESTIATLAYPAVELPKPPEERASLPLYLGTAAAGESLFHGLGKLLERARTRGLSTGGDTLERALGEIHVGGPAPAPAPTVPPVQEQTPELEQAVLDIANRLLRAGRPEEQVRNVLTSELIGTGVHYQDAYDIATQAVNRLRLLEKTRSEFEIKDAATKLARIHLSRGTPEADVRKALVAGLRQEFGKSEKEASALADDVLARFRQEAPPAPTTAAPAESKSTAPTATSGATVGGASGGEIVEFHAGIPLTKQLRLRQAGNTRDLFTPITEISATRGSLPADVVELLPPDLRYVINELDRQVLGINQKMRELLVTHGVRGPQELPQAAREEFEQLAQALENTRVERENWRPLIEEALGEIRQGRFSKSLLEKIESGKLVGDSMPITDKQGNVIGRFVLSPLEGKKLFVPEIPEATTFEEAVLSRAPGIYAHFLGAMRDVLTEPVVRVWRNANRLYEHFTTEYEKRLLDILKPVLGNKEARERIYYMLEGKMPLTGVEGQVARRLREEIYDPLFKEFGIDPERYLKDYAPRIRQHGAAGLPADFTGPLKFFAELERTGELLPRETDALTTTLAYIRLGAKAKYFEPARRAAMPYVLKMHPDRRKIYEAFVNSVLRRPLWDERIINNSIAAVAKALGKEVNPSSREYSAFITNLAYLGTIGFNPMTVLKNLTQQVLAVASLTGNPATGLKYWFRAQRALRTQAGRKMLEFNWVAQDRTYLEGLERLTGFANRILRPLNKAGFWAFEAVDRYNVNTSYMMKLLHALDQGKPLAAAVESANTFAASTQFLYGLDSPLLYKSPVGRLLGMLTSYPVNFMRLLWEQGATRAASILVSLAGMVYLLNKTGLDFTSESPLGVAEGWLPVAFLLGGRSVSVPGQTVGALGEVARRLAEGDPVLIDEALRKLKENLALYLPGTIQRRRIEKFIDAARHDWQVLDEEGKLKYRMTPGEAVRSLIGTTRESRERWEEHKRIAAAERWYRDTRRKAIEAYLRGDREALERYQNALREKGLRPVTRQDVRQYLEYQRQTALERHRRGLPRTWTGE